MDYPRRNSTKLFTIITNRSILWVFIALSLLQTGCGITANGWNAEGVKLYETGHFPEAIERFQYALGTDEQNADDNDTQENRDGQRRQFSVQA